MKYQSIVEAIADHAKQDPDKLCICENDKSCTYGECWEYVQSFCAKIQEFYFPRGSRIVVQASQTIDYLVASFAVHLAGGILVPADKNAGPDRVKELIENTGALLLIAPKPIPQSCPFISIHEACTSKDGSADFEFPKYDELADILFTTGTTGKAKGVMLDYRNQVTTADNIVGFTEMSSADVVLVPLPLSHAGGTRRTYAALFVGATVVLMQGVVFIDDLFTMIETYHVTTIFLVPAFLAIILGSAAEDMSRFSEQIRAISIASAVTPEEHKRRICELLPKTKLFIAYGGTEAGNSCCVEYNKYPEKLHCIGTESRHAKLSFVDDDGNPMMNTSLDNPGILVCEGPNVMKGYWKDPALTAKILSGSRVVLADMGYRGEDGMVYLLGRRDDVINTGGNKVAPYEIEELALRIPDIAECACISVPDKILGHVPKLFVVMKTGVEFSYKVIFDFLLTHLEPFKMPRYIESVEALPKTEALGKIKKFELK